jgi:cytoskeletal protein RodZ
MADFGARLRQARERKGLTLGQIAKVTKIAPATLDALERNDVSRLPGGIFTRSFVRSYASKVGLDPDRTLREFLDQFEDTVEAPGAVAHPGAVPSRAHDRIAADDEVEFESRQKMASVVLKLVLISLPIAIAAIYLNSRAPQPPEPEEDVIATERTTSGGDSPAGAPDLHDAVAPASIPGTSSTAGSTPPRPSADERAATLADGIVIDIAPTGECWVQLTVDGRMAVSRVLVPGDRERHRFIERAVLQVGDAAACTTFLNGRPTRPLGRPRQVRTVTITPDNYAELIP